MKKVTIYSTEPCAHCRNAKALLEARGIIFDEINLAKDPVGRAELAKKTGMTSFPQILVDDQSVGGFRELLSADQQGQLTRLLDI